MQSPHLSQNNQVLEYYRKVSSLYEIDYGDFKRKLGQYTNQLEESLGSSASPEIKKALQQIRNQIVFNSAGSAEAAIDSIAQILKI